MLLQTIPCPRAHSGPWFSSMLCHYFVGGGSLQVAVRSCRAGACPTHPGSPLCPAQTCPPPPQLVIKSACFSLLCQLHPRPAGPADRTGPPAPPLSRPLPSLLPVGSPSDLSEMQIRGCHFLLKSRKQPPILIKRKPKLLTTANKALHALALSTASLPLPS